MRLVEEANKWHKMASIRVAAVFGAVVAYLAANPAETQKLLDMLPEGPMRTLASVLIGVIVFSGYAAPRLVKFKKEGLEDHG